jgi:hypothetical protein
MGISREHSWDEAVPIVSIIRMNIIYLTLTHFFL